MKYLSVLVGLAALALLGSTCSSVMDGDTIAAPSVDVEVKCSGTCSQEFLREALLRRALLNPKDLPIGWSTISSFGNGAKTRHCAQSGEIIDGLRAETQLIAPEVADPIIDRRTFSQTLLVYSSEDDAKNAMSGIERCGRALADSAARRSNPRYSPLSIRKRGDQTFSYSAEGELQSAGVTFHVHQVYVRRGFSIMEIVNLVVGDSLSRGETEELVELADRKWDFVLKHLDQ
jgi:hypothetical protein